MTSTTQTAQERIAAMKAAVAEKKDAVIRGELRCDGQTLRDWSADTALGWLAGLLDALEYPLGVNRSSFGGTFLAVDVCVPPVWETHTGRWVKVADRQHLFRVLFGGKTLEQIAEEVEPKVAKLFDA